ncbi:MAG TPA: hypothetical protein DCS66_24400, partial [Flavobacteriaceae bacterium]|nr:hypothetical protein [Flavobacteriaceae bacterium]
MKKIAIFILSAGIMMSSCVPKKKYVELEAKQNKTQNLLNSTTVKLNACEADKAAANATIAALEKRVIDLKQDKEDLIKSSKDLTILTQQGATNLEKSLESLKEK